MITLDDRPTVLAHVGRLADGLRGGNSRAEAPAQAEALLGLLTPRWKPSEPVNTLAVDLGGAFTAAELVVVREMMEHGAQLVSLDDDGIRATLAKACDRFLALAGDKGSCGKPRWDSQARTLCFDGHPLARFSPRPSGQVMIIETFAAEGWPAAIESPLEDLKSLRYAVKRLQSRMAGAPICFSRDQKMVRWSCVTRAQTYPLRAPKKARRNLPAAGGFAENTNMTFV